MEAVIIKMKYMCRTAFCIPMTTPLNVPRILKWVEAENDFSQIEFNITKQTTPKDILNVCTEEGYVGISISLSINLPDWIMIERTDIPFVALFPEIISYPSLYFKHCQLKKLNISMGHELVTYGSMRTPRYGGSPIYFARCGVESPEGDEVVLSPCSGEIDMEGVD
jgi:hypothetical protein